MRPWVWVAVFVRKWNKFLLGKRKSEVWDKTWCIPWWHLEFWETFEECVKRETYEEANISIVNVKFLAVNNDIFDNKHYVTICMISDYKSGNVSIENDDEFYEWKWVDLDSMPEQLFFPFENLLRHHWELIRKELAK